MDIISLSIPAFFVLIGVELVAARLRGRKVYRFNDSINDLSCGILNQLGAVFSGAARVAIYAAVYHVARVWEMPADAWWTWVIAIVGVDFTYYWFHRHSHEINAMWAAHIVHHQSEEYNLTVALRQSTLEPIFSIWYRLPLAILGIDPLTFATANALNTLYQFWVHTRLVGKLGPLEWVFTTPSHHRVHHGRNPKYLDRNYSGFLILWDRLFGTFQEEEEEPAYGITTGLGSWNPVYANLQYPIQVMQQAATLVGLDKVLVWWHGPSWGWPPADEPDYDRKYDATGRSGVNAYVLVQFIGTVGGVLYLLFAAMPFVEQLAVTGLVTWALVDFGALFERRRWAPFSEALRLSATTVVLGTLGPPGVLGGLVALVLSVLWLGWLTRRPEPAAEAAK
ncbi:MAG: sterol desaturase family protein [Alphaproteobacteria bacterium]|nr:sterol desaturase family protein [Alphaproteobacteria bacterium]